jgi:hypothetical protein
MTILYRDSDGSTLWADAAEELGAGGQARVVGVAGQPEWAAKLYHAPAEQQVRKLRVMLAHPPAAAGDDKAEPRPALVWPADLLRDAEGRTVGLLMPRVSGMHRAFELYNPATRRVRSPGFHYARLHRTARNVAAAFAALHAAGYVVGDANESNVLVDGEGNVTVIDTDSFQVSDPATGEVFRCPVGRPEFAPPELQGRVLGDVDRTPEHDRFALGVLVFQLLMEGTHPFAGQDPGAGDPLPIPERIALGLFPHAPGSPVKPPRNAPPLEVLHPLVRAAARRCFELGHASPEARPHAHEWVTALDAAFADLRACGANPGHRYGSHLRACPWCQRTRALGGRDPFPSAEAIARGEHLKAAPRRRALTAPGGQRRAMRRTASQPFKVGALPGVMANRWAAMLGAALVIGLVTASVPTCLFLWACILMARGVTMAPRRTAPALLAIIAAVILARYALAWNTTTGPLPSGGVAAAASGGREPRGVAFDVDAVDVRPGLAQRELLAAALSHVTMPGDSGFVSLVVDADGRVRSLGSYEQGAGGLPEARATLGGAAVFSPASRQGMQVATSVSVPVVRTRTGYAALLDRGSWTDESAARRQAQEATVARARKDISLFVMDGPKKGSHIVVMQEMPLLLNREAVEGVLRERSVPSYSSVAADHPLASVRIHIRDDGTVAPGSVKVISRSRYADAAREAARVMYFEPAVDNGQRIDVWAIVELPYPDSMP